MLLNSGRMFLASPHCVATKTCEGIRCKEFARQQVIDALVPPVRMHGHPFHMHYSHQQQQLLHNHRSHGNKVLLRYYLQHAGETVKIHVCVCVRA